MRLIIITFLFILFSSNYSLAKNNEKITVEEIETIFFGKNKKKYPIINQKEKKSDEWSEYWGKVSKRSEEPGYKKRHQNRGIAKCLYDPKGGMEDFKRCDAKIIRAVMSYSEKSKKRRQGDIFYALDAIRSLVGHYDFRKQFYKSFDFKEGDKPVPGMVCTKYERDQTLIELGYYKNKKQRYHCLAFKKGTYKRIKKFEKDPLNEKVLGHKLIKYIKNVRMINNIEEKIGTSRYSLIGDMLNDVFLSVEKNKISPDLKLRRTLLKKYVLKLTKVENKLNNEDFKSLDKDMSSLSVIFEDLKSLSKNTNKNVSYLDDSIVIISETNDFINIKTSASKNSEKEKEIALASIHFMKSLLDSILFTIPEKYYVETKGLSKDLWVEFELEALENILDNMMKRNNKIKSEKFYNSIEIIGKSLNTSEILKSLEKLGIKNRIKNGFQDDSAIDIADLAIRENLENELLKDVRKIVQEMDRDQISDLAKEATEVAKEVSKIAKEVTSQPEYKSFIDRKVGNSNYTWKQIIAAHRNGSLNLGTGNR